METGGVGATLLPSSFPVIAFASAFSSSSLLHFSALLSHRSRSPLQGPSSTATIGADLAWALIPDQVDNSSIP
jgi:hypothetical protein